MAMTNEQFKNRRLELGLTQQQLADALMCSLRAVQYYEGCGPRKDYEGKEYDTRIPGPVEVAMKNLKPKRKKEVAHAVQQG